MSIKGAMTMRLKAGCAILSAFLLAGCISFGPEAPEQLLTLTPVNAAPVGAAAAGDSSAALAVTVPSTSQRLNVVRIPVLTSDSSLAYLQDAFWVEKPARLFQRLLAETIRAKGNRLVIGGGELDYAAPTQLGGELLAMEYVAPTSSVVVRYDALLQLPGGRILTRRFERTIPGVAPEAAAVGAALNDAANQVADEVAEWVG